jgi:peptidoglycan/LPS O-acetylase OafA/YrhL
MRTLADGLAQKSDNFLLLRFIAASMVIYGHAPAVTGHPLPADLFAWLNWGTYSGSIAVDVFFIVSGFLVTGSFLRNPQLADFAWARAIRIVPGYAFCLLL